MMGRDCSWLDPSYQHHITFACIGCYQLHPPLPSRHYYPRLIAGTNLPTPKGWIVWLAKADCTHITFAQGYYTIESKGTRSKWTQVVGSKTNSIPWTNHAVHYRPRIKSQKTAQSAVGVPFRTSSALSMHLLCCCQLTLWSLSKSACSEHLLLKKDSLPSPLWWQLAPTLPVTLIRDIVYQISDASMGNHCCLSYSISANTAYSQLSMEQKDCETS